MATDLSFVEYIRAQSGLGTKLSFKRMFGEYAIYLHEKVVAMACDNQLFVKPTAEGRGLLATVCEQPPFPGAKRYFRIDDEIEDGEALRALFEATARALPEPRPRKPAKKRLESARPRTPKKP